MKHITKWLQLRLWVRQTATEVPAAEIKNVPMSLRNLSHILSLKTFPFIANFEHNLGLSTLEEDRLKIMD